MHFETQGSEDGTPIVLIEGLGAHMLGWRRAFKEPLLAAGFHVVSFDNRDVGLSQRYEGVEYDLADMAEDVHELIHQLGIGPAHIVGQSMGGMIAQHLVVDHPDDVASLALLYTSSSEHHLLGADRDVSTLETAGAARTREEAEDMHIDQERICASTKYSFDESWKRELGGLMWDRGYHPAGIANQRRAISASQPLTDRLAEVSVPTLLIHGTADNLISFSASEEIHGHIYGSELWIVDGMGHDLPLELLDAITSRIVANTQRAVSPSRLGA